MTVVAVKKENKKIEMSCDSQATYGFSFKTQKESTLQIDDFGKIFSVNGLTIGSSGNVSESNLMKVFCKNHKPKNADIDSVVEFMSEFREWIGKKTGENTYNLKNHILIVYKSKIFEVAGFYIQERKKFWAVGSGMFLAISAMHLGKNTKEAVNISKEYDLYCGGKTETIIIKNKK